MKRRALDSDLDRLLTTEEAADLLGLHPFTLHRWRSNGETELPWYKIANRIRYRLADLREFVEAGRFGKGVMPAKPFGANRVPPRTGEDNVNGRQSTHRCSK